MEFIKCKCGQKAVWDYMPGYSYFCDDCVPRGCSCNRYYLEEESEFFDSTIETAMNSKGVENIDWKWIDEEKTAYVYLDDKLREYPCCEFMFDEEGYEL